MTAEQLAEGYASCYRRLFSATSIWRRRPTDWRAVLPYLAMSYLYKKSNRLWHLLIKHRLVHTVWRPLVELTRRRHLKFPGTPGRAIRAQPSGNRPARWRDSVGGGLRNVNTHPDRPWSKIAPVPFSASPWSGLRLVRLVGKNKDIAILTQIPISRVPRV